MRTLYFELESFSLTDVLEYEETVKDLKENLKTFEKTLFPANKFYKIIDKLDWIRSNEKKLKRWQIKASSIFSLSKLYECLIQSKLPKLRHISKDISYDIYSMYFNSNR